ncbi:MAG: HlyD family efflux transporter periplasmic adaptor subunit, partial [Verrucomicrobia bacterium]
MLAVLVFLVLMGGYYLARRSTAEQYPPEAFYRVQRGNFVVSVVEGGTLEAVNEVVVRNEVEGTARIIYIVPEGTYVKKGDLLVELDSSQAQDQVNQQEISYAKAELAFTQAKAQLEIQRSITNSEIDAAALELRFAQMDLEKFEKGEQWVTLLEASNRVVQAEAQLAVNQETYRWTTNLVASGYETKQRADADRLSVLNSRNNLIAATNALWLLREFDLVKQHEQLLSNLREASNNLARVVAQARSRIAQYEADVLTQSNTLELSRAKLERDRRNLANCKIYAPQDGLVVYPVTENRFSSQSMIEEGATVRNRQELIKLPDTSKMKVRIKIHETYVNLVREGQPAVVTLDPLPDRRFKGVVSYVALVPDAQSRWGNPNLKVYKTEVLITDPLPDIKPGVSARAEIIITNIADAISVPIQAVTPWKGRPACYVRRGGRIEPVPVEVGLFSTRFIEIKSGLQEGDEVLLVPPYDARSKDLEGKTVTSEEAGSMTNTVPPETSRAPGPMGGGDVAGSRAGNRNRPPQGAGPPGAGGFDREALLKRFDRDGDGRLSEEERQAIRQEMQRRFGGGAGGVRP